MKGFSATTGVKATLVSAGTDPLRGKVVGGVPEDLCTFELRIGAL